MAGITSVAAMGTSPLFPAGKSGRRSGAWTNIVPAVSHALPLFSRARLDTGPSCPSGLIHCGIRKTPPRTRMDVAMNSPAKNRLHDYKAGRLTMLVSMRVATEEEARAAMCRVAQKPIDDMDERR